MEKRSDKCQRGQDLGDISLCKDSRTGTGILVFSTAAVHCESPFFYHKDYFPDAAWWNTLKDLKSYTIGGVRGYWYEADFAKAGLNVKYTTHPEESLKKLQVGRIQLFPVTDVVGWHLVEKLFPDSKNRFGTLEKPYDTVPAYLMVSKAYPNSEHLLKQFDEMFQKTKETGEYQNVLKKNKIAE